MKTLEELRANREKNIGKNYEIPEEILLEAEEAYESGRQSYIYVIGEAINDIEQVEWWRRCCPFVEEAFHSYGKVYIWFIED